MLRKQRLWVMMAFLTVVPTSWGQIIIGFGTPAPRPVSQGSHPPSLSLAQIPRPSTTLGIQRNPECCISPMPTFGGVVPLFPAYYPIQPIVMNQRVAIPTPEVLTPPEAIVELPKPTSVVRERASLKVQAPSGVEVWIDGKKFGAHGGPFIADSPELKPGERYGFSLRLVWPNQDQPEEEVITVQGGQERSVQILGAVKK